MKKKNKKMIGILAVILALLIILLVVVMTKKNAEDVGEKYQSGSEEQLVDDIPEDEVIPDIENGSEAVLEENDSESSAEPEKM